MQKRSSSKSKRGSQTGDDLWQWAAHREESAPTPVTVQETAEPSPSTAVTVPGKFVHALSSLLGMAKDPGAISK